MVPKKNVNFLDFDHVFAINVPLRSDSDFCILKTQHRSINYVDGHALKSLTNINKDYLVFVSLQLYIFRIEL